MTEVVCDVPTFEAEIEPYIKPALVPIAVRTETIVLLRLNSRTSAIVPAMLSNSTDRSLEVTINPQYRVIFTRVDSEVLASTGERVAASFFREGE